MTAAALDTLLHTLGLDDEHRDGWRNHLVAGAGHHASDGIAELLDLGLFEERVPPSFLPAGDRVYAATPRGMSVARTENDRRHPPRRPAQARYLAWLGIADVCDVTFGEYLRRRMYDEHRSLAATGPVRGRG